MEGSFIGALLFGYPFVDLGILDLALLALVGFLLVWRFVPGPRSTKKAAGDSFTVGRRDRSSTELPPELQPGVPPGPARKDVRAGQGGAGASRDGAFDEDEFLEGARTLYIRMQEAWAEQDTESLSPFMTPDMMRLVRERAAADPNPAGIRVLLLNADLLGLERRSGEEWAGVKFSALTHAEGGVPEESRGIWRFVRRDDAGGTWRLAGIEEHEVQP